MPACVKAEGDYFRNLSKVQIPGVDAIWNQIWPGTLNDFPKLASSVAHVYGKPRAFSESFAAYHISPTIPQAKFVVDHQIARGINFFEFMFWPAGSKHRNWMSDPGMKGLNEYTNRTTYLMSQGSREHGLPCITPHLLCGWVTMKFIRISSLLLNSC